MVDYQFTKPRQLVKEQGSIGVAGWSPDGKTILFVTEDIKVPLQTIESIEIDSGQRIVYGTRPSSGDKPVWVTVDGQVIGVAYTRTENQQASLWFVDSATLSPTKVSSGLQNQFIAFRHHDQQLLYVADHRLVQLEKLVKPIPNQVDLSRWEYVDALMLAPMNVYRLSARPNASDVLLYNQKYSFVVNPATNTICAIKWKERAEQEPTWAVMHEWSPDGRFLSSLLTTGTPPVNHVDLTLLDTASNTTQQVTGELLPSGRRYVNELTWAPHSDVMATLMTVAEKDSFDYVGIYLVDAISLQTQRILPTVAYPVGNPGWNLAWSPTGSHLALTCNEEDSSGLCISEVHHP